MRVAIDAMILGPRDTGVGLFVRELILALSETDRENEYLVYHGRDAGPIAVAGGGNMRLVQTGVSNRIRGERIAWEQFALPGRLRRDGVNVLHSPAYIKPIRAAVPTLITVHDLFALTHPRLCKWLNVLHYQAMLRLSIRTASLIHCNSEWTRSEVARLWPDRGDRVRVVRPGIDARYRPVSDAAALAAVRERYGLGGDPPLVFVGNIEPKKNLALLLRAFKVLRDRHGSRRRLVIVGQRAWKWRPVVRLYEALGLGESVVWTGYVPTEDLPAIYSLALCLVFPSICEGFGFPPLEAMRCGTPVVVSDAPALVEAVGEAALVSPRDSPEALAAAVHRMETDAALRARLRQAGQERSALFDWAGSARRLVSLYRELAESGRECASP